PLILLLGEPHRIAAAFAPNVKQCLPAALRHQRRQDGRKLLAAFRVILGRKKKRLEVGAVREVVVAEPELVDDVEFVFEVVYCCGGGGASSGGRCHLSGGGAVAQRLLLLDVVGKVAEGRC